MGAFPSAAINPAFGGMSLRDWLAGQALSGIIANSENVASGTEPTNCALSLHPYDFAKWLAYTSYLVADAMLAEREKGGAA